MSWNPKIIKVIKICASLLVGVVVLGVIGIGLWKIPALQVEKYKVKIDETKPFDKDRAEHDREILKLENELRINYFQNLAQTVGGLVVLLGVYFAWRNLQLAEDGKITDRYSSAIAQLGNRNMTVRIGGIYALERIARDSQKDHWTVMEALCAFIRDESNKIATTAQAAEQPPTSENGDKQATDSKKPKLRSDIQIALTVIGRRSWVDEEKEQGLSLDLREANLSGASLYKANLFGADLYKADLYEADLSGADLTGAYLFGADLYKADLYEADLTGAYLIRANLNEANLGGANLYKANLYEADLSGADLSGAYLIRADLTGAYLIRANLNEANLGGANLYKANLTGANLGGAYLSRANLSRADLSGANLNEADLTGAYLSEADLRGADLSGAEYNELTQFPEGFDLARLKPDTNEGTE